MTVTWSWALEAYLNSSWTSLNNDIKIWDVPIEAQRGIDGGNVTDRVAGVGSLTFSLDNSKANSGSKLGYYSPDHANLRTDFERDALVRLSLTYGGSTQYIWRGWLREITPSPGQFKERHVEVYAEDYMYKLVEHKLDRIAVQSDKRPDQLISTILSNVPISPQNQSLATDTITFNRALHSEQDERSTAMSAITKTCLSALGYFFIKGNTTDGETATYQMRHTRSQSSLAATLDDTMSDLKIRRSGQFESNKVILSTHPATVDTGADTVLGRLAGELELGPGKTQTIEIRFRDPSGAATRISGENIVTTLTADTHYKMSSVSEDGGNDLNGDLDITVTAGGNMASVQLENTGAQTGYINKLEIWGDGIYLYDPIEIVVESGNADKVLTFDLYYQDDYYVGKDFATAIHAQTSADVSLVESVSFYADASANLMGYAMNCDIGSRVKLIETATGIDSEFFINKIIYRITIDGRLQVEWVPEPASITQFLILNDTTYGKIDTAENVLAF